MGGAGPARVVSQWNRADFVGDLASTPSGCQTFERRPRENRMSRFSSDITFPQATLPATPQKSACPVCSQAVDVFSRHVIVDGSAVKIFCSAECMAGKRLGDSIEARPLPRGPSWLRPFVTGGAFLGVLFVAESTSPEPSIPEPIETVPAPAIVAAPAPVPE